MLEHSQNLRDRSGIYPRSRRARGVRMSTSGADSAAAGHRVLLFDARNGAAQQVVDKLHETMRWVKRLTPESVRRWNCFEPFNDKDSRVFLISSVESTTPTAYSDLAKEPMSNVAERQRARISARKRSSERRRIRARQGQTRIRASCHAWTA
jgi:hypothetical protein